MTKDAQSALRRTMEKSGRSTKFCLICNYVSRIIEPITSRCAKFRFKPLAREILIKRLDLICDQEKVKVSEEGMEAIVLTSEGDLRKAITSLQSCARLKGDVEIAKDDVYEISGVIPEKYLEGLLEVCQLNSYDRVQGFVDDMICEGFSGHQLINQLHDHVVANSCFTDIQKLAASEHFLLEGADEYLHIMSIATTIMKVLRQG
jgi:replication factor C subunit 2/4